MDARTADIPSAEAVIATLKTHAAELRAAGIRRLSLFGSVARGEATPDSDVDLVADIDRERRLTLIDLAGIEIRLSEILGRKVDLTTEPVSKERLRANIERDRLLVF
jgi:uncharacterized protein